MMNNIIAACLTKKGVPCIFPFMLAGDFFLGCTDFQEPSKKPWCATKVQKMLNSVHINCFLPIVKVDEHLNLSPNQWGYCSEGCPVDQGMELEVKDDDK